MGLSFLDLAAIFLVFSAVIGWLNLKLLRAPTGVVMLAVGLAATLAVAGIDRIAPGLGAGSMVNRLMAQVDFSKTVLRFMLAYLLFAGAVHVDLEALLRRGWTAGVLATAGVVVSAAVIGGGFWLAARMLHLPISFAWALVFGVLMSPTDPVAVLAALKRTSLVPDIRALIEGEALFNDGVGVVLFGAAVTLAQDGAATGPLPLAGLVLLQAGGGAALGGLAGWLTIAAMRSIDDYLVEVGLTLALSTATYALAQHFGLSGPIAVVVAGLMLSRHASGKAPRGDVISAETRRYVTAFWTIVDENLNAVLFLLVGLAVLALKVDPLIDALAAIAIPLTFLGRWASLIGPTLVLGRIDRGLKPGLAAVLTWAGVRGGLSLAMALALPPSRERSVILAATYVVVVFSVIVQSLTLERLILRTGYGRAPKTSEAN